MPRVVPVLTATSTVPELITFLRYAISDDEYAEAETILVNREHGLKAELQKLRESHEDLKQELSLLETKPSAGELQKLAKLYADHAAVSDRMKESEETCRKLTEKLTEAEEENARIVLQVKETFQGLERKMEEILKYEEDRSLFVADFTEIRKLLKRGKWETPPGDATSDASAINGGLGELPSQNTSGNKVVPTLTETSSVTELVTFLRYAFKEDEFKQVETILRNRENSYKMEVEELIDLLETLKEERDEMEKNQDELKEMLRRSNEDHEKITEQRCQKAVELLLESEKEKSLMISQCTEKIKDLERVKFHAEEKFRALVEFNEALTMKVLMSEKEKSGIFAQCTERIKALERLKLQAGEIIRVLVESNEALKKQVLMLEKEKSGISAQCTEKIKALECENLQVEEKIRVLVESNEALKKNVLMLEKEKSGTFAQCTEKIEALEWQVKEKIRGLLESNEALKKHVSMSEKEKSGIFAQCTEKIKAYLRVAQCTEKIKAYLRESRGGEECSDNEISSRPNVNVQHEIINLWGTGDAGLHASRAYILSNSPRAGSCDSQKQGPHPTDLAGDNELATGKLIMPDAGRSDKLILPSKDITGQLGSSAVFIDLSASDDDEPIGRNANVLKGGNGRSCLENEKTERDCCENYPEGASKRKRSACENKCDVEDHMPIAMLKRKKIREFSSPAVCSREPDSVFPNVSVAVSYPEQKPALIKCCEKAGKEQKPQLPLEKPIVDGVDESSYDSGGSGGHSYNDIQVSRETTWMYAADMLSAFKNDPELCMSAVCALYRQEISATTRSYSSFKQRGFCSLHVLKGSAMAKYFIDNDPENKLRRSVSEVRRVAPEMLDECERLATQHYEHLFEIYQKKLDPYFGPRL